MKMTQLESARELAQSLADCELLPGMLRRRLRTARRPGTLRDALDDAALRPELDGVQKMWALQAAAKL